MSERRVLGIDVASASWSDVGTAAIDFDEERVTSVVAAPIAWPNERLTPAALARIVDGFVREYSVCAVALDGPQGWRDPETASHLPGVGRRCEYQCRTQGKTGVHRRTYPANQVNWIEFSIELFECLLAIPGVTLAEQAGPAPQDYLVLECFPTSAWRSSGLRPLPAKAKKPPLDGHKESLRVAYGLPQFDIDSHDDLQAVVAALCAVGVAGGPVVPLPRGVASRVIATGRIEGLIWDVSPLDGVAEPLAATSVQFSERPRGISLSGASVCVTPKVLAQVNRVGISQMQIALRNLPGATKHHKLRVKLRVEGDDYVIVLGDSHAVWRTHQDAASIESFDQLFAIAADSPGQQLAVSDFEILADA